MPLRRPSHPFHTPSRTPPSRTPSRTPAATLAAASVRRGRALAAAAALPAAAALRRRPASPSTPPLPLGPPSARPLPAAALDDDAPVSALALAAATLAVSSLATSASPEERVAIRINIIIYRLVLEDGGGLDSKRLSCPRLYRVYTLSLSPDSLPCKFSGATHNNGAAAGPQ